VATFGEAQTVDGSRVSFDGTTQFGATAGEVAYAAAAGREPVLPGYLAAERSSMVLALVRSGLNVGPV
jgi:hypothetical protein